jgi:hypothetical protein
MKASLFYKKVMQGARTSPQLSSPMAVALGEQETAPLICDRVAVDFLGKLQGCDLPAVLNFPNR